MRLELKQTARPAWPAIAACRIGHERTLGSACSAYRLRRIDRVNPVRQATIARCRSRGCKVMLQPKFRPFHPFEAAGWHN